MIESITHSCNYPPKYYKQDLQNQKKKKSIFREFEMFRIVTPGLSVLKTKQKTKQ